MRLKQVETGHTLKKRMVLGVMRLLLGMRAPDVVRTIWYRPELFGEAYSALMQDVMRGESSWSVGERELFAAFSAKLQRCPF